jgi:hypothetical protein
MSVGDWSLAVTGTVTRIDREDLDKSGRNPNFMLSLVIQPAEAPEVPDGARLPDELAVRIKGSELPRLTPDDIAAGDAVELTARASGAAPRTLYLTAIKRVDVTRVDP